MPSDSMMDRVAQLMRRAAAQAILPRFRALHASDIEEKSPGELVTVADREAEVLLTSGLLSLLPGAAVLGEEAASTQAHSVQTLQREPALWVIDPLDGTSNFVEGTACFSVMVALMRNGETVASWMLDPVTDVLAIAEKGSGAQLGGRKICTEQSLPTTNALRGAVLTRFLPPSLRSQIEERTPQLGAILPGLRCAGHEYPAVAIGAQNFALFWRTEPWDHAPGALFISEAGGHVARLDGTPYSPLDQGKGLLLAQNQDIWYAVQRVLLA